MTSTTLAIITKDLTVPVKLQNFKLLQRPPYNFPQWKDTEVCFTLGYLSPLIANLRRMYSIGTSVRWMWLAVSFLPQLARLSIASISIPHHQTANKRLLRISDGL